MIVLSAPSLNQSWDSVLGPLAAYRGLNCLLGWDAQLLGFGAALRECGAACLVTPAPEMFFTPVSWAAAVRSAGIAVPDLRQIVHIRFGGGRFARVLRGVPNFLAVAEAGWNNIMAPGAHPFRNHDTAPQAIRAMLDLCGGAGPLRRPDGTAIERLTVPEDLLAAGIPAPLDETRPLRPADFDGLEICGAADFDAARWNSPFQARRLMLDFNANSLSLARRLVLLPWNLANPVGCVPDLAKKLLRVLGGDAGYVVLLPFNAAGPVGGQLAPVIEKFTPPVPENLLIARVTGLAAANLLRRLGATAWIDGLDPEAAWTQTRLEACGIPCIRLMGPDGGAGLPALLEKTMTEISDEFGRRFLTGHTMPARNVAALTRTGAAAPAPRQPFQPGAFTAFLARVLAAT